MQQTNMTMTDSDTIHKKSSPAKDFIIRHYDNPNPIPFDDLALGLVGVSWN
jgi:hypothetical protein